MDNYDINDFMVNLKIISKIKEKDKLYIKNKLVHIEPPYALQFVYRTINRSSRKETTRYLFSFYRSLKIYVDNIFNKRYMNPDNFINNPTLAHKEYIFFIQERQVISDIKNHIIYSNSGLYNLIKTYHKDLNMINCLEHIINNNNKLIENCRIMISQIKKDYLNIMSS